MAHINKVPSDNRPENLAWLCLEHHDSFDSVSSQSKNYTKAELSRWRDKLHAHFSESSVTAATESEIVRSENSRNTNYAWRSPLFSASDGPQLFPYRSRNHFDGVCVIELVRLGDGRVVIACISVAGNPGSSITNTVETIAEQVCMKFELLPEDLVWLENYEYINPAEWLHVTFGKKPPDGWGDPKWTEMDLSKWEDLGLRPVGHLRTSHGQLVSKLRKVRPK